MVQSIHVSTDLILNTRVLAANPRPPATYGQRFRFLKAGFAELSNVRLLPTAMPSSPLDVFLETRFEPGT